MAVGSQPGTVRAPAAVNCDMMFILGWCTALYTSCFSYRERVFSFFFLYRERHIYIHASSSPWVLYIMYIQRTQIVHCSHTSGQANRALWIYTSSHTYIMLCVLCVQPRALLFKLLNYYFQNVIFTY